MMSRVLLVVAMTVGLAGVTAACSGSGDNKAAATENNVDQNPLVKRDRTTGTRHEVGCAGRRRCY